jgi:hypothetical protein
MTKAAEEATSWLLRLVAGFVAKDRGLCGSEVLKVGGAAELSHLLLDPASALAHVGRRIPDVEPNGIWQHRREEGCLLLL